MPFGEYALPTDTLAAILGAYPFSVGLFRELLQNSDDARATKQVFVLDSRMHGTATLVDPKLADTQGPSLLAYNDALFSEEDWDALQSIHRSSKKTDSSKIGKYGIGFRSCYHVTDNPQVLSGPNLAILDPHHNFTSSGGTKFDFALKAAKYRDHLRAFDFFLAYNAHNQVFPGSVIRLPLRLPGAQSSISSKAVSAAEIRQLFDDFIREEIGISLLFLRNVTSVEVHEIDAQGGRRCLAKSSIQKMQQVSWDVDKETHASFQCTVNVETPLLGRMEKTWRIVHSHFDQAKTTSLLALRLGHDPRPVLAKHKLLSEMAIAVPLSILDKEENSGRLFTYLPLPLKTGFPGHVHALFALTASRQNLNNGGEIGIVRGSEDSVLVEWNYILFESFLPRTWAALLKVLLQADHLTDVFRAWPPAQTGVFGGDTAYWQALPAKLLECIVVSKAEVLPVVVGSKSGTQVHFAELGSALVASSEVDDATLRALANAGLRITLLPQYILKLLGENDLARSRHTVLTPGVAYRELCNNVANIKTLDSADRISFLKFLLQNNQLENLVGLPLLPLVDGEFVAPLKYGTVPSRTMLDQTECDVFGKLENSAISLPAIPPNLRELFRTQGPSVLNVCALSPEHVATYLKALPFGHDLSQRHEGKVDLALVNWLSKFWAWLGNWPARDLLFPLIGSLYVVPADTSMESLDVGVFNSEAATAQEQLLVMIFRRLGLAFLHPALSAEARKGLTYFPLLLKSVADVHLILDRIKDGVDVRLEREEKQALSKHVLDCVLQLGQQRPLDENQRRKLRLLPIFPLLAPSVVVATVEKPTSPRVLSAFKLPSLHKKTRSIAAAIGAVAFLEPESIASDAKVLGVPTGNTVLLPAVDGVVYLDGAHVDLGLLPQLAPSNSVPLSSADILALALEHFTVQSKDLQSAFLDYIVRYREALPPTLLKTLQQVPFVLVQDGTMQAPERVIDPSKPDLVALYSENKDRLPIALPENLQNFRHLRSLGLLADSLTVDIVTERIQFISSRSAAPDSRILATRLLTMMYTASLDYDALEIPLEAKWLPTVRGLVGRGECFDYASRPELFDEVVPMLERNITLPPILRMKLGWDQPLPMTVLLDQFRAVINGGAATAGLKLDCLIKEFSVRPLTDAEVSELCSAASTKPWIPIATGRLSSTNYAVFSATFGLPGFSQIPVGLAQDPRIHEFLLRMGCSERPSAVGLVSELKLLEKKSSSIDVVEQALKILEVIADDIKSVARDDIVVPDSDGILRSVSQVYFNDVGDRACLIDPDQHYIAHPKLSDELSKRLLMDRLGFKSVDLTPGVDMGETLTTTIRNVLKQYSEQQICNEFLANACDAGATKFGILVDEYPGVANKILCTAMAPFITCPSLIFYNSGEFTAKDFEGICRTGIGGKEGKTNTIGQFGLGVLSMFHYTEMAMIVSGSHVLFLDPSKTHLPIQGRASLLLPLDQIKRFFSDHLQCLDGLFGFHMDRGNHYPGTLFRLPLRKPSHLNANSILVSSRITPQYVREKIVKPYWISAKQALIFTKLESITTFSRDPAGKQVFRGWSLSASRDAPQSVFNFRTQIIHIHSGEAGSETEDFKLVFTTTPLGNLPTEFAPLVAPQRLRSPITVGLAAPLSPSHANHSLFSTLPLPMTTTLPVHLTASFILTPDRRHVRLDDYENLESKYNKWLLSVVAPPLYLFLLEDLLRTQAQLGNEAWWPGNTGQQDSVSKHLVDAFYSTHLASTKRRACASVFDVGQQLRPSDVLLGGAEPSSVTKILSLLNTPHIVRLPAKIRERCGSAMTTINPSFVQGEIKQKSRNLISLFQKGEVTTRDIQFLLDYLAEDLKLSFVGLPLLPLANGKLAVVQASGSAAHYVWKPTYADRMLFRPEYLVASDFVADIFLDKTLNVTKFTASTLESLIKEHFPEAAERTGMKAEQQEWIKTFWAEYPSFGLPADVKFTTFPLVQTTQPGNYVSLGRCWTNSVILVSNSEPIWLCNLFRELGASVVQRDSKELSKPLRELLKAYPHFSFEKTLQYFQTIESSIPGRFAKLDSTLRTEFADWARGKITGTPERLIQTASALPIWKKLQKEEAVTLHAASELKMLPFGISRDIATRFINVPSVEHNVALVHLKIVPMNFDQFWQNLKLPTTLKPEDQHVYKQLLTLMPTNFLYSDGILVPNGNRTLVKVNTLYTRHNLFVAAFGSDSSPTHFVLDSFRDLEPRLVSLGLKSHTNLDVNTFKECVRAIQADSAHPNITARARVVFKAYGEDMPLRINSSQSNIWSELDKLRFVPREPMRRRTMQIDDASIYVKSLQTIVSPKEVLLAENEAVAWTQRAVVLVPPDERLLLANPSFGQPTAREVVDHLRVLAFQVAKDFPSDIYLLSDLEATYRWLDDHQDEVEDIIIEYHDRPLFLNVVDPRTDPWVWHSADEMFFNILDGGELKSVKKFLHPFKDLLTVAGVEDIVNAPVPGLEPSSVEMQLTILRTGFDAMRRGGQLTDVVFVCDDETRHLGHRAFLAPMSEYLNDLFCGSFAEAGPGTAEEPVEVDVDYSGPCVEAVLDYMYLVKPPALERLDDLLDVMDLSNYWALGELNQVVQAKIIRNNQISPATYEEVFARATTLDAKILLEACAFFERENREAIQRLKGEYTGKRRAAKRLPKKPLRTHVRGQSSATATESVPANASTSKLKLKPAKVAKGLMKGLRKVGDTWDFLS